jgi:hypothetical protein
MLSSGDREGQKQDTTKENRKQKESKQMEELNNNQDEVNRGNKV